jgi:hypothetical protein
MMAGEWIFSRVKATGYGLPFGVTLRFGLRSQSASYTSPLDL